MRFPRPIRRVAHSAYASRMRSGFPHAVALLLALVPILPQAAHSQAASDSRPAALLDSGPAAWADHPFDLIHVEGDLTFDFDRRQVSGRVTNVLELLISNPTEVPLDAEGLRISGVSVDGHEVAFRQEGRKLLVSLGAPAPRGKRIAVTLAYECNPVKGLHWGGPEPGYEWKWLQCYSQGQAEDNHHWIPTHDYPNDRATWTFTYRVPEDLTAVGNGTLVSVKNDSGTRSRAFTYAMDRPNCTYLISVAIGPWERYADDWRGIPVEYFVGPGQGEERARRSFGRTPEMMEFFSEWIGVPYPWVKYSQTTVMEFVAGGMENVSATTQSDTTLHDERSRLERDSEGLVSHELAHQWWGDLLTCNGWRHLWLNEGFATYFTALWFEHSRGLDDYRLTMDNQRRAFLRADPVDAPRALVTDPHNRRGDSANAHVYTKGSSVLHMLRFVLGDENFRSAISLYARRHAGGLVETRDLERAVADATGLGLEWFWHEWTRLQGAPSFEVSHAYDTESKRCIIHLTQTQAVGPLVPLFKMPVDILLGFEGGATAVERFWIEGREHRFEVPAAQRPLFVRFDEGSWIAARVRHARTAGELGAQARLDPDAAGRREACDRLAERLAAVRGSAEAKSIIESLDAVLHASDEHRDVRAAAAAALKHSDDPSATASLTKALRAAPAAVRRAAAESLGSRPASDALLTELWGLVKGDPAYGVRAAAVRTIGELAGPKAWEEIVAASAQASERDVVAIAALETLRAIDAGRSVPILLDAAASGRPYESRERSLTLLSALAQDAKASGTLTGDALRAASEVFRSAARSNHWRLRIAAIRALGQTNDEEGEALLQSIAAGSRDSRDVSAARAALDARSERKSRSKP